MTAIVRTLGHAYMLIWNFEKKKLDNWMTNGIHL
jgi:hypothetical protein